MQETMQGGWNSMPVPVEKHEDALLFDTEEVRRIIGYLRIGVTWGERAGVDKRDLTRIREYANELEELMNERKSKQDVRLHFIRERSPGVRDSTA